MWFNLGEFRPAPVWHIIEMYIKPEVWLFNLSRIFPGHHKTDFIPDIVGPVLEMTLIPETGVLRL